MDRLKAIRVNSLRIILQITKFGNDKWAIARSTLRAPHLSDGLPGNGIDLLPVEDINLSFVENLLSAKL
jgi:hypothetical protein